MWTKRLVVTVLGLAAGLGLLWAAPKERPKASLDSVAFHGAYLAVDMVGLGQWALGDNGQIAVQADVNLYNRFNPCISLGYAPFDLTGSSGTRCYGQGFFGKVGVNVPVSTYGPNAEHQFYVGAHYGYSNFDYHLENVQFPASYWNEAYSTDLMNQHATAHWLSMDLGMRTQIWGPLSLGWCLRIKKRLSVQEAKLSVPAYIPGYGENNETNYAFSFNLYCLLAFKR